MLWGPVFSAVGGFVADRYIGSFRAVYIGYTIYTIGFFLLGLGASDLNIPLSIFSIALIGYARGLSATSPTVLLGNSYSETNRDAFQQGLTVNYSINNLGSFSSKYLFPFLVAFLAYQGEFLYRFRFNVAYIGIVCCLPQATCSSGVTISTAVQLTLKPGFASSWVQQPCLVWFSGYSRTLMLVSICYTRWVPVQSCISFMK